MPRAKAQLREEPSRAETSLKRRQVWSALHAFIRNHGGVVTSVPDHSPIRFECSLAADLPKTLEKMGFNPVSAGSNQRLMPITETLSEHGRSEKVQRDQVGLATVEIYEIDMPEIAVSSVTR